MIPKLHYYLTASTDAAHLENIQKACSSGAELVQLDLDQIPAKHRVSVAQEVLKITTHFQTRLVIKKFYKVAHEIKADGVYLEQKDACPTLVRKQLYPWQTIGASAHSLEECNTLLDKEVDYIGLGPFKTTSDTQGNVLGKKGYLLISEALDTETPLLGFGGITTADVTDILATGVSGMMVAQAITADFNSIKTFHELLGASSTDEMRHTFK